MDWDFMMCDSCGEDGSENWMYLGEAYDDDEHLGATWTCVSCGHVQCDDDPQEDDFSMYDDRGYDYNDIS